MDVSVRVLQVAAVATVLLPLVYAFVYSAERVRVGLRGVLLLLGCATWLVVGAGMMEATETAEQRRRAEARRAEWVGQGCTVVGEALVPDVNYGERRIFREVTLAWPDGTTVTIRNRVPGVSAVVFDGATNVSFFYVAYCVFWRVLGRLAWRVEGWVRRRRAARANMATPRLRGVQEGHSDADR